MKMVYLQVFLDVPWQYFVIFPHIGFCTFLAKFTLSFLIFYITLVNNIFFIIFHD